VENTRKLLDKSIQIGQEAISPQYFVPYPIDVNFTAIYRPSQVTRDNQTITYNTENNGTPSANLTAYIRRLTTLNTYWQRLLITRMGKDADINMHRVFIALQSNSTGAGGQVTCENSVMVYPSSFVQVKNGCDQTVMDANLG
jgi:hypothetical protein